MAWETRSRGTKYYTRSIWRDGKVQRVYIGRGEAAEREAARDAAVRSARLEERQTWARWQATTALLTCFSGQVDQFMTATLEGAGYHRPGRHEWRRKRGTQS